MAAITDNSLPENPNCPPPPSSRCCRCQKYLSNPPLDHLTGLQERRLLTGSNNGELKMWNFNSGTQLRQFVHHEEHVEYSSLLFVHDADRQSNLVSWHCPSAACLTLQHMSSMKARVVS